MDREQYLAGVTELYQGEVLGEGLFSRMLVDCAPEHKPVLSLLLQVESEAKVRLRPLLFRLGLPLTEDETMRASGISFAAGLKGVPWHEAAAIITGWQSPYLQRYRELEAVAPAADKGAVAYMVRHEQAINDYFRRQAQHESPGDVGELLELIDYPLPVPA